MSNDKELQRLIDEDLNDLIDSCNSAYSAWCSGYGREEHVETEKQALLDYIANNYDKKGDSDVKRGGDDELDN